MENFRTFQKNFFSGVTYKAKDCEFKNLSDEEFNASVGVSKINLNGKWVELYCIRKLERRDRKRTLCHPGSVHRLHATKEAQFQRGV